MASTHGSTHGYLKVDQTNALNNNLDDEDLSLSDLDIGFEQYNPYTEDQTNQTKKPTSSIASTQFRSTKTSTSSNQANNTKPTFLQRFQPYMISDAKQVRGNGLSKFLHPFYGLLFITIFITMFLYFSCIMYPFGFRSFSTQYLNYPSNTLLTTQITATESIQPHTLFITNSYASSSSWFNYIQQRYLFSAYPPSDAQSIVPLIDRVPIETKIINTSPMTPQEQTHGPTDASQHGISIVPPHVSPFRPTALTTTNGSNSFGYISACLPPITSPLFASALRAILFISKRTNRTILLSQSQPTTLLNGNRNSFGGRFSQSHWKFAEFVLNDISGQHDQASLSATRKEFINEAKQTIPWFSRPSLSFESPTVDFASIFDITALLNLGTDTVQLHGGIDLLEQPSFSYLHGYCIDHNIHHVCLSRKPLSKFQYFGTTFDTCGSTIVDTDSKLRCTDCFLHPPSKLQPLQYLRQPARTFFETDENDDINNPHSVEKNNFVSQFMKGKFHDLNELQPTTSSLTGESYLTPNSLSTTIIMPGKNIHKPFEIQITSLKDFEYAVFRDFANSTYSTNTMTMYHLNSLTLATYGFYLEEQQTMKPNKELRQLLEYYPPFNSVIRFEAITIQQSLTAIAIEQQQKKVAEAKKNEQKTKIENSEKKGLMTIQEQQPAVSTNGSSITPPTETLNPTTTPPTLTTTPLPIPNTPPSSPSIPPNTPPSTPSTPPNTPPNTSSSPSNTPNIPSVPVTPPTTKSPETTPSTTPPTPETTPSTPKTTPVPETAPPRTDNETPMNSTNPKFHDDSTTSSKYPNPAKNTNDPTKDADHYGGEVDSDAFDPKIWEEEWSDLDGFSLEEKSSGGTLHTWFYDSSRDEWFEDTEDDLPPTSKPKNKKESLPGKTNSTNNSDGKSSEGNGNENKDVNFDSAIPAPRNKPIDPSLPDDSGNYRVGSICGLLYNIPTRSTQKKLMKLGFTPQNYIYQVANWVISHHCTVIFVHSHSLNTSNDNKHNRNFFVQQINTLLQDLVPKYTTLEWMWGCNKFSTCGSNPAMEFAVTAELLSAVPAVLVYPLNFAARNEAKLIDAIDPLSDAVLFKRGQRNTPGKVSWIEIDPVPS